MPYIGFPISALVYISLILIIYYSKKRINLFENKVLILLMCVNIFGLGLELCCYFVIFNYSVLNYYFVFFILKSYIVYIAVFNYLFNSYVLLLSKMGYGEKFDIKKYFINISLMYLPMTIIFVVLCYFLPLHINFNPYYTYGISVNILCVLSMLYLFSWIIRINIVIFKHKIENKKIYYSILIGIILIGVIGAVSQIVNPEILLITSIHSLVLAIIYFTIENPDVKMLRELANSKKISDNANYDKSIFLFNMTKEIKNVSSNIDILTDNILEISKNNLVLDKVRDIKYNLDRFNTMINEILNIDMVTINKIKIYNNKYNIKNLLKEIFSNYLDKLKYSIDVSLPEYLYGDAINLKEALKSILDICKMGSYIDFSLNTITKGVVCRLIINIGCDINEKNELFKKNGILSMAKTQITLMGGTVIPSDNKIIIILDQKIYKNETVLDKYHKGIKESKILIVENNISSRKIINKLLDNSNINVTNLEYGKECLDKIRNGEKYDLIFISQDLEYLSGIEVMNKLKTIDFFKTPVVLLTKDNSFEYNDRYKEYGFSNVIVKPLNKNKFYKILDEFLT